MAVELLVKAGEHDRELCPVKLTVETEKLGEEWKELKSCTISSEATGAKTAGQCEASADGESITISWILDNLKAGTEGLYVSVRQAAVDRYK